MEKNSHPTLGNLYPKLSNEEVCKAEQNLEEYLGLVVRIYERIKNDSASYAQLRQLIDSDGTV